MRTNTPSILRPKWVAVIGSLIVTSILLVAPAPGAQEPHSIEVNVAEGKSEANNVGCLFALVTDPDTPLQILLDSNTQIKSSGLFSCNPETQWQRLTPMQWRAQVVLPGDKVWCVIKVEVERGRGAGKAGKQTDPSRWMSVSDVDLDADTDNDSEQNHRWPMEDDTEDLLEYPPATPTDYILGLLIGYNDDNDMSWEQRDGGLGVEGYKDSDIPDDEVLEGKLKITAKKDGKFSITWPSFLFCYDDEEYFYDPDYDDSVARNVFFDRTLQMEAQYSTDTDARDGEIYVWFTQDTPVDGWHSGDPSDKIRVLALGADLDVDSDNNGWISSSNYSTAEDFYENHGDNVPSHHPEFKDGMLVTFNDNDTDGNGNPDNGWDGVDWDGPDAATIQNDADKAEMQKGFLRELGLSDDQDRNQKAALNDLGVTVILRKVNEGGGAVRVFAEDGRLIGAFIDYDDSYESAGTDNLFEIIYGKLSANELKLRFEGLKKGLVVLEAELVRTEAGMAVTVHKDVVRITVITGDLLRTEIDGTAPINDTDNGLEEIVGAVVVQNKDDDDRDNVEDLGDGRVKTGEPEGSQDENDLKKFLLVIDDLPTDTGTVVLRRSNGKVRVYSDKRKGVAADFDKKLLWSEFEILFNAGVEGNGKKTWDLSVPAERTAFQNVATSGIWVEGSDPSASKRDTYVSLEYLPAGEPTPSKKDIIRITVIPIVMGFVQNTTDTGNIGPTDPLNKIANPAVIVIDDSETKSANEVARLVLETAAFIGDDDEFIEWEITNDDGQASFYTPPGGFPDNRGKMARVYGSVYGRVTIKAKVKAADEAYILYRPLVAAEKELTYRCNFLKDPAGVKSAIEPNQIPNAIAVANIILRQTGIKLVPDADRVANIPSGTVAAAIAATDTQIVVADAETKFCKYARLKISKGDESATAVVDSVDGLTDKVTFTGPIGKAFGPGATVKWDLTVSNLTVPGCIELSGIPNKFVECPQATVVFAGFLNNSDGMLNYNFVKSVEGGCAGMSIGRPGNIYVLSATGESLVGVNGDRQTYTMGALGLITTPPYVAGFIPSVVTSLGGPGDETIARVITQEFLHGCHVKHRGKTPSISDDGVLMGENLPVVLPVADDGSASQNVMHPAPAHNDIDVLQSVLLRGGSMIAKNPGNLVISPETTLLVLSSEQEKSGFTFTVTRNESPVNNAAVSFHLIPDPGVPVRITSADGVKTNTDGEAAVSLKGLGAPVGSFCRLIAVAKEGVDTVRSLVTVGIFPLVSFKFAESGSEEDTGQNSIEVVLSAAIPIGISVDYAVTGGTATRGTDYTLADGTLEFAAGVTTRFISIALLNDAQVEGDETVEVTLTVPANECIVPGSTMVHTYTINDDD